MCIYIHTHKHTHMYVHIYTAPFAHVAAALKPISTSWIYTHTHTHTYIYIDMCLNTNINKNTYTYSYLHTHIYTAPFSSAAADLKSSSAFWKYPSSAICSHEAGSKFNRNLCLSTCCCLTPLSSISFSRFSFSRSTSVLSPRPPPFVLVSPFVTSATAGVVGEAEAERLDGWEVGMREVLGVGLSGR